MLEHMRDQPMVSSPLPQENKDSYNKNTSEVGAQHYSGLPMAKLQISMDSTQVYERGGK